MTTEALEAVAPENMFQSRIMIEWPAPDKASCGEPGCASCGKPGRGGVMQAWKVTIRDTYTGEYINTATAIRVITDPGGWVIAEMTELVGVDGQPLRSGPPDPATGRIPDLVLDIGEGGRPKTAAFRYLVTGMSVCGT